MSIRIVPAQPESGLPVLTLHPGEAATFGRNHEASVRIPDQSISRLHCRIDYAGGSALLRDLNSSNGTFVAGARIEGPVSLQEGTVFSIGDYTFRTEMVNEGPALPPARPGMESTVDLREDGDEFDATKATFAQKLDVSQGPLPAGAEDLRDERVAKRLNCVCTFANRVFALSDERKIMEEAVQASLDITGAQRCSAIFLHRSSNLLDPVCFRSAGGQALPGAFPVSKTIVRHVIKSGESIMTTNAGEDDRFALGDSIAMQNITSVVCVPLLGQEGVLGALYADNTNPGGDFDEQALAIMAVVAHQSAVAVERSRLVLDLEKLFFGSIHALAASIEAKDKYTKGHSERVTCYSLMIADELGLDARERTIVELAGLLHDVGKIGVPEAVLCSKNRLSDEEFLLMQEHPGRGADIIRKMPELARLASVKEVADAARHHHEKFNGTGYPDKLAGTKIPQASRILAVADTFDAITSTRTYRPGQPPEKALTILRECAGTQVDPDILAAFERVYARGDVAHPERVKAHIHFDQFLLTQSTARVD